MKKKEVLFIIIVFVLLIVLGAVLIRRKIYWEKKWQETRKIGEDLKKETKKKMMQRHTKHIESGIKYKEECEVCRGLWKD